MRKPGRLRDRHPHQSDRIAGQNRLKDGDGHALKAFLNRRTGWRKGLEPRGVGSNALHYHRGEERLLAGKAGIDRWLSRARSPGDLVDACAFKSMLQEDLAGRIEDAFLNLARELLWRAPKAHP